MYYVKLTISLRIFHYFFSFSVGSTRRNGQYRFLHPLHTAVRISTRAIIEMIQKVRNHSGYLISQY